jgi:hypothetical protein
MSKEEQESPYLSLLLLVPITAGVSIIWVSLGAMLDWPFWVNITFLVIWLVMVGLVVASTILDVQTKRNIGGTNK